MSSDGGVISKMFDEVRSTTVEKVNGKPCISDVRQIADLDFAAACEALIRAEKRFAKLHAKANPKWVEATHDPAPLCEYFDALEARYQADKRLWLLFTAGDRSVRSNKMYNQFRLALLSGKTSKADA